MKSIIFLTLFLFTPLFVFSSSSEKYELNLFSSMRSFHGKHTDYIKNSFWFDLLFFKNLNQNKKNYIQIGVEFSPFYKIENETTAIQNIQLGFCGSYNLEFIKKSYLIFRFHTGFIHATLEKNQEKELVYYGGLSAGLSIPLYKWFSAQFHYGFNYHIYSGQPVWVQNMNLGIGFAF